MSKEAAMTFRDKVNTDQQLQVEMRRAIDAGNGIDEAIGLGRKFGLEFTAQEAFEAMNEVGEGELTDFELELVAGGKGSSKSGGGSSGGGKGSGGNSGGSGRTAAMGKRG